MLLLFMSVCTVCASNIYFAENTINSLISLLSCVVFSSCSLILLRVEFLSFAYILVYGGAVVVLFLFVILSTDLRKEDTWRNRTRLREYRVANFLVFIIFFIFSIFAQNFKNSNDAADLEYPKIFYFSEFLTNDIFIFSKFFYTHFFILFILLGILLLVALVGSVALCMKHLQRI